MHNESEVASSQSTTYSLYVRASTNLEIHKQLRENICKISNLDPRSRVRYIIVGTLKVKGHEEGHRTDKDMFGGINRERS